MSLEDKTKKGMKELAKIHSEEPKCPVFFLPIIYGSAIIGAIGAYQASCGEASSASTIAMWGGLAGFFAGGIISLKSGYNFCKRYGRWFDRQLDCCVRYNLLDYIR